jgi:hypothetical protein
MASSEFPPAPPGTQADAGSVMTAEGDQVSVPWGQVWMCAGTGRPDEGPPTEVEPGALAGAWVFGTAGSAQVDQYAIVYQDQVAAEAAGARAQDKAKVCADAFTSNPEYGGGPPVIETGVVPSSVDGVKVTATFSHEGAPSNMVSSVMGSGATVQYVRFTTGGMLDPAYIDSLIAAAAAALTS